MPTSYEIGPFRLDTEAEMLFRGAEIVSVGKRAVGVLCALVERAGAPVAKEMLMEAGWPGLAVEDSNLTVQISALRRAFGQEPGGEHWIETLPRHGYRFVGPVKARVNEADASNAPQPAGRTAAQDKPSIAILPFENLSADPEQQYFADGMAEDLITDLSKISGLRVLARNSSFALKGEAVDIKNVAERLGVKHILEGSVRKMGSKIRVNTQLINAVDGSHTWAERYDGNLENIFRFQDDIREQIVSALRVSLSQTDRLLVERRSTESVRAYDLFLKGRASYFRYTPEDHAAAKGYFEQAIALDAKFADAYSFLSYWYTAAWNLLYPGFEDGLERALPMAEKAVSLDPGSAIAHMRLGWTLCFMRQFDQALSCFEKAIALGPDIAEVCSYYGMFLNYIGRPEEGLRMIDTAYRLEPIAPAIWDLQVGYSYWELGRFDDAVVQFRKVIDRVPGFPMTYMFLASVYVELGRLDEATEQLQVLRAMNPMWSVRTADRIFPIASDDKRKRFLGNLREAGLPE